MHGNFGRGNRDVHAHDDQEHRQEEPDETEAQRILRALGAGEWVRVGKDARADVLVCCRRSCTAASAHTGEFRLRGLDRFRRRD